MDYEPVLFRGHLVAIVGPERFYPVAPWMLDRPTTDPDVHFVVWMCEYRHQVETGALPGPFTSERAELFARCALIDHDELLSRWDLDDDALAEYFNVPADQIALAREECRR